MELNDNIQTKGRRIKYFMDNIQPTHRKALRMRFYERLSYQEISDELNLDLQAVKLLIFDSVRILRKGIKNNTASSEKSPLRE